VSTWRLVLFEEVLIDLHDSDRALDLHTNAVADDQTGQALPVDQDDSSGDIRRVVTSALAEAARGDEDALTGLIAVQRADESLYLGPAHRSVQGLALRPDVDSAQYEGILVDNSVDAAVVGEACPGRGAFRAAVAHCHEEIQHRLFEERRVLGM
jgi:hypothetical protein